MAIAKTATDSVAKLRALVAVLFVAAMTGLFLTAIFGFETADDTLLFVSSGLLLAAFAAVFAHLWLTGALTPAQKRAWLRRLTGGKAPWAWGEYLACGDLSAALDRFDAEQSLES